MTKRMLVDATHPEETRVAIVDERFLEDFDFESASKKQLKGNIYLAKVVRIEPSLQAAFVEYGGNRHGFLPFSEIHPDYFRIPMADRPHDEGAPEGDDEAEVESDSPSEAAEAAYAEQVQAYQSEHIEGEQEGESQSPSEATEETSSPQEAAPAPASLNTPFTPDPAASPSPTPNIIDMNMSQPSAMGSEGDIGLITDFGNAAVEQPFVPTPVEVVGGQAHEEEEIVERIRRPRLPRYKIQEVVKRRQIMLIQVVKEERGNKGAALTTYLSLAGRYCVLMPNTDRGGGVSRKITSHQDRKRMKDILDQLEMPEGMAIILRTAGMEQNPADIQRDLEHLLRLWNNIREQTLQSTAPTLIYEEANLIKRSVRDLYSADVGEILVAGQKGYDLAQEFVHTIMPEAKDKVSLYQDPIPLFFRYNVEKQIDQLYNPIVQLRSGGYIVINPTEALVSIDVNSGRATRERHIEGTALKTNLEAADEIARQLRLRDLAGLVVIDFIDMEDGRNNAAVERRMKEAMKSDRARLQIGRISPFGLMELSRQRLHPSLTEINFERCTHCAGVGLVRSVDSSAISILRAIEEEAIRQGSGEIVIHVPTKAALYILNQKRAALHGIESRYGLQVQLHSDDSLALPDYRLERAKGSKSAVASETPSVLPPESQPVSEQPRPPRGHDRNQKRHGRDRDHRPRQHGNFEPAPSIEANGNVVSEEPSLDDNIGNVAQAEPQGENGNVGFRPAERHEGPRHDGPRHDGQRQGRRRGRRGGRGRHGRDDRDDRRPDNLPREPQNFVPPAPVAYVPPPSVPFSVHDLDTTPKDHREPVHQEVARERPQSSLPPSSYPSSSPSPKPVMVAPPPSPYEITNPESDKPKGGWWRKLRGQ